MADQIGDDTPEAFSAHPDLAPVTVKPLRLRYDYLCAGDSKRAIELARLSASDEAGDIAAELNKSNRNPEKKWKYFHPTIWAGVWRDKHTRPKLRRMVRDYPQRQHILASCRMAADDEPRWRGLQLAELLIEQVELAAQPLRPEEVDRLIDNERQRAENYRRAGVDVLAWICERRAAQHARDHERDFRTEAEREDAMIRAAARRLIWNFGMRGDWLVAGLVGKTLGRKINSRRVCYLMTGR
jgi:hypothetical protein